MIIHHIQCVVYGISDINKSVAHRGCWWTGAYLQGICIHYVDLHHLNKANFESCILARNATVIQKKRPGVYSVFKHKHECIKELPISYIGNWQINMHDLTYPYYRIKRVWDPVIKVQHWKVTSGLVCKWNMIISRARNMEIGSGLVIMIS